MSLHYRKDGQLDMRYNSSREAVANGYYEGGGGDSQLHFRNDGHLDMRYNSSRQAVASGYYGGGGGDSQLHFRNDGHLDMRYNSSRQAVASGYYGGGGGGDSQLHFRNDGHLDMRYNSSRDAVANGYYGFDGGSARPIVGLDEALLLFSLHAGLFMCPNSSRVAIANHNQREEGGGERRRTSFFLRPPSPPPQLISFGSRPSSAGARADETPNTRCYSNGNQRGEGGGERRSTSFFLRPPSPPAELISFGSRPSSAGEMKSCGTPVNKNAPAAASGPKKADGTPDMRYAANKNPAPAAASLTSPVKKDKAQDTVSPGKLSAQSTPMKPSSNPSFSTPPKKSTNPDVDRTLGKLMEEAGYEQSSSFKKMSPAQKFRYLSERKAYCSDDHVETDSSYVRAHRVPNEVLSEVLNDGSITKEEIKELLAFSYDKVNIMKTSKERNDQHSEYEKDASKARNNEEVVPSAAVQRMQAQFNAIKDGIETGKLGKANAKRLLQHLNNTQVNKNGHSPLRTYQNKQIFERLASGETKIQNWPRAFKQVVKETLDEYSERVSAANMAKKEDELQRQQAEERAQEKRRARQALERGFRVPSREKNKNGEGNIAVGAIVGRAVGGKAGFFF